MSIQRSISSIAAGIFFSALFSFQPLFAQQEGSGVLPDINPAKSNAAADALFFDAVKARMKGDDKQAADLLLQFIKQRPDEPAAYYDLSRLSYKANQMDKASEYIKKAIALDGKNKWYQEQYANILANRNQFAEAADVLIQLARQEQYNEDYLLRAARFFQRAGKHKEALITIDKMISKLGEDEDLLIQKQQIYLSMNDLDNAAKTIQRLIDKNPREPKYYALLAELYERNKQPEKAATVYSQIEQAFPNDPLVQLSLANHYKTLKNDAKYNEYLAKAITNKDLDAETQIGLLIPYLQDNAKDSLKVRAGIRMAEEVVRQHSNSAAVQAFYGDVLAANREYDRAAEAYKRSVAIDGSKYAVWEQLFRIYALPSGADSLIRYTEKALRLFPNQSMVHYFNGVGYYNKKNYPSAIRAINRAIDLQPEDNTEQLSEMHAMLGDIYNLTKDNASSDSSYEKAIRYDPKNASALNNYAYYLSERRQRLDDAERMSRTSLQLRPGETTFLDTYGWILYQQGKFEKAREYIQKAIDDSQDQADATLWEHLGDINYKLHNTDQAVENWKTARQKGSNSTQLDKKIQDRKLYE